MSRPKGFKQSAEANAKAARAHEFRNALFDAGSAVMAAAEFGGSEKAAEVAAEQLARLRAEFGDELSFRLTRVPS